MNSIVIGSGFGGIAAALRLRAKGHEVTIIEKHPDLGGRARVFKKDDDLTIWVSDDKNHLLVKVEMGIWVGSIDAYITSAQNIKFPLSITD